MALAVACVVVWPRGGAGQQASVSLADLLAIRRETLQTRDNDLDRSRDAALIAVELAARAGLLP